MKKTMLFAFLMISIAGMAQQLNYGTGGTVFTSESKKLTTNEVRQVLAKNSEALAEYNAGRNKKTWGNVLFYGGLGLVTVNLATALTTDNTTSTFNPGDYSPNIKSERSNLTAAIIGGAMIIASIPIKIGYPKRIKKALGLYNNGTACIYESQPTTTLLASANQIGVRITF
jgi:hypothetical protein